MGELRSGGRLRAALPARHALPGALDADEKCAARLARLARQERAAPSHYARTRRTRRGRPSGLPTLGRASGRPSWRSSRSGRSPRAGAAGAWGCCFAGAYSNRWAGRSRCAPRRARAPASRCISNPAPELFGGFGWYALAAPPRLAGKATAQTRSNNSATHSLKAVGNAPAARPDGAADGGRPAPAGRADERQGVPAPLWRCPRRPNLVASAWPSPCGRRECPGTSFAIHASAVGMSLQRAM